MIILGKHTLNLRIICGNNLFDHFGAKILNSLFERNSEPRLIPIAKIQWSSTLYSWLNAREILAWNRHGIWSLSDRNGTWTHNHLVCKRILNHLTKLAKWLSFTVSAYLYGTFDCMFFIMSSMRFRVNLHSKVGWISRKSFLKTDQICKVLVIPTRLEPTIT